MHTLRDASGSAGIGLTLSRRLPFDYLNAEQRVQTPETSSSPLGDRAAVSAAGGSGAALIDLSNQVTGFDARFASLEGAASDIPMGLIIPAVASNVGIMPPTSNNIAPSTIESSGSSMGSPSAFSAWRKASAASGAKLPGRGAENKEEKKKHVKAEGKTDPKKRKNTEQKKVAVAQGSHPKPAGGAVPKKEAARKRAREPSKPSKGGPVRYQVTIPDAQWHGADAQCRACC